MTSEQEKQLEQQFKKELEDAYIRGIGIGAKTATKVIYDKLAGDLRPLHKNDLIRLIKDIRKFCETGLAIKED